MPTRTIILVDVVGSVRLKLKHGEQAAQKMIDDRLDAIEKTFQLVDPTIERRQPSEGDSLLLLGTATVLLFQAAVLLQAGWKSWYWSLGSVPATRIALGSGEFDSAPDAGGRYTAHRGIAIDLTARIKELLPIAGVGVTESVRSAVQAAGFAYKLDRRESVMKGFPAEPQSYYLADGVWAEGDEPMPENFRTAPLDLAVPMVPVVTLLPPPPPPKQSSSFWNGRLFFWKVLSIVVLAVAVGLAVLRPWRFWP